MLHAQLYFLFVFEARNLIFLLFRVNKVLVLVLDVTGLASDDIPSKTTVCSRETIQQLSNDQRFDKIRLC